MLSSASFITLSLSILAAQSIYTKQKFSLLSKCIIIHKNVCVSFEIKKIYCENGRTVKKYTHTHTHKTTNQKKNTYTTFDEYIENISGKMREIHVILLHHSNPLESIFIRFDEK